MFPDIQKGNPMYSSAGFLPIHFLDSLAPSPPMSPEQLSRNAHLGALVRDARGNRRQTRSSVFGQRRSGSFIPLLATR